MKYTVEDLISKNKKLIARSIKPALIQGVTSEIPLIQEPLIKLLQEDKPENINLFITAANGYLALDGIKATLHQALANNNDCTPPAIFIEHEPSVKIENEIQNNKKYTSTTTNRNNR